MILRSFVVYRLSGDLQRFDCLTSRQYSPSDGWSEPAVVSVMAMKMGLQTGRVNESLLKQVACTAYRFFACS